MNISDYMMNYLLMTIRYEDNENTKAFFKDIAREILLDSFCKDYIEIKHNGIIEETITIEDYGTDYLTERIYKAIKENSNVAIKGTDGIKRYDFNQ